MNIFESYEAWFTHWTTELKDSFSNLAEMLGLFLFNLLGSVLILFIIIPLLLLLILFPITAPIASIILYLRDRRLPIDQVKEKVGPHNYHRALPIVQGRLKVFPKSKYYNALLEEILKAKGDKPDI